MAAIHPPSSNHYEPQARCGHCSAFVSGKIFMYGGHIIGPRLTQPPTMVDVFDLATEKWEQIATTGPPPPGFINTSCTVIDIHLYVYAGRTRISYSNNIQELNTTNLKWTQLNDANQGEAPMAKSGAAMIPYNEKILITIGGFGILPSHRRSGTEYILDPDFPGRGWTNELLCFDVNSRTWSSPHTTCTPPPASSGHSFTMVDLHRAVLYGGVQQHHLLPSHVYILDVQQWMWTTITGGGPNWPVARFIHSAVSLHHPDSDFIPDPAVMVMWGQTSGAVLSDCWVFQVNFRQWRKVILQDTLKGRFLHSTTVVHTGSTLKKIVNYGGIDEVPRNVRDYSTYIPVAETTVIEIEPPSSDQESKPTIDVKPKLEPASPTDEKPTLSELKTEPVSPDKKDIKPEQVRVSSEQGEESLLKENALLRHIVAHQKKEIMGYQETVQMYRKSLQEGQTLPTSEQAIQTDGDNTPHVRTTEYLRGFESFAETSFVITGRDSHSFEWQGYGLKLHIPEEALPGDHKECRIDIKAGLSGQFIFPEDSQLVSCVYWISCSQKFLKSVTLDIEHCASVQDSSQSSSLCFVAAKCSQADLPYQFKELKQATFSPQSSFGSLQVSQFSFFGVIAYKMCWWLRRYRAIFQYTKGKINQWWLYFFITWNLSGCRKAVETELQAIEAKFAHQLLKDGGFELEVEFQEPQNSISLDIQKHGQVLESGWKITPITHPGITKEQVDRSQSFPHCCLSIEWTRVEEPVELEYVVDLIGAKGPSNYICIKRTPEGLGEHSQKRGQKQEEDYHHVRPKREKLSSEPEIQTGKSLDIRTLTHELKSVTEWFQLGGQLDMRHDTLKQIEQNYGREMERCKTEMLNCWLQGDPEASWIKVVEAVQRMDHVVLAQQLQKKYIHLPSRDEDNQPRSPLPQEMTQGSHLPSGSHVKDNLQ